MNSKNNINKTSIQWTPGRNLLQQSENILQKNVIFEKSDKKVINYA